MNSISDYPITMILIAVNVILSLMAMNNADLLSKMVMWPYGVKRYNQYYRFITSGFIHSTTNYFHIIFNMMTLYFFGRNVEVIFNTYGLGGNLAYLALYFFGMIAADIPSYFQHRDNSNYSSLGASGAVSAVVFSMIVFDPWMRIFIFGAVPLSGLLYGVLYIAFCVAMARRADDNINHSAHLWGSLFGLGFTIALVAAMQPQLFDLILEQLKHPALLGRV